MSSESVRYEHDLIGDRAVPADAYYGVHTLRALENFAITGSAISIYPELVNALACVKQAAALANNELGLLDALCQLPAPVPADLDRAHLVAIGIEGVEDGASRGHRDVVLARAAAHEHGYARPANRSAP